MPHELTTEQARRAREDFQRALDTAKPITDLWQLRLFNDSDEDYIHKEAERKLYEPTLPNGGNLERNYLKRLKKISEMKDWPEGAQRAWVMMQAWQKVLPDNPSNAGWYYVRRKMKPSQNKEEHAWLEALRDAAKKSKEWDKHWLAQMALDGLPEPVADFKIECLFLLKMPDGKVWRMVRLRNVVGESTGVIMLDPEAWHAPQKFRLWCLGHGNFHWGAGEKELNLLHNDIGRLAAWRVINSVVTLGWLPLAERISPEMVEADGIWFYGDCAYANTRDRLELLALDADSIYWHRKADEEGNLVEEGYRLEARGLENKFHQGKPRLYPETKLSAAKLALQAHPEIEFYETPARGLPTRCGEAPQPHPPADARRTNIPGELMGDKNDDLLRVFFRELCVRLRRAVGTEECNLLVGSFLSFAAAPEIYAKYSMFPGLWVHGEAGSGKSTMCEWLMEVWGYSLHSGLSLKSTSVTPVGLLQCADQYSNHPVWADEYQNDHVVGEDKLGVIHAAYNRSGQAKFNPSAFQREMRTNFIVSGESTTGEAATRGRFPHVQISKHQREGSREQQKLNKDWFDAHRKYFYFFGRYLMEHRREFVRKVLANMESWSREDIDARLKVTHGVGYASWLAMVQMLQSHTADEVGAFRGYMVQHSQSAQADVTSDLNVNVFIEDLITLATRGELRPENFRVTSGYLKHAPDAPDQNTGWESEILWIEPKGAILDVQVGLRKAGRNLPLKEKDIRDQLKMNPFFVRRGDPDFTSNMRFGRPGERGTKPAWGIRADFHPLGYRRCGKEDFDHFLHNAADGDPRKGPLYSLIEWIKNKHREWEREEKENRQADAIAAQDAADRPW